MKTKAMLFGTFDLLHPGHEYIFSEAKKEADYVIVVLARDIRVEKIKGRTSYYDENIRKKNLEESGVVDEVCLGDLNDVYAPIRTHSPDIILLGYDQEIFVDGLEKLVFEDGLDIKIRRLKAYKPEECKSSILRKNMEK